MNKTSKHMYRIVRTVRVFHNGIGFDIPVLSRLWNFTFDRGLVLDTLIMSRLAEPSRSGGHSLDIRS